MGLEDEEVVAYLNRNGIELPRGVIDKFSAAGRDLLRNPLHLNCLVEYVRNKGAGKIPKNLAEIYGACVASMIEKKVESDGGVDVDYLLYQLGSYALESLVNRSTVPCRRFLMEKLDVGEVEKIEKTGKASGLLVLRDGSVGFPHAVFQEYLASVYLAKQDDATIKTFCELNSGNPLLKNLFVLLCGCTADKVKQALILDCLEENNLTLFMDCLRGRMNLSREMEEQFDKESIETIVSQALKTYTNITSIYFSQTKPFIPFWKRLSYPDALLRIEAQYDVTSTVIRIVVKERKPDEEPVLIQFCDDGHGPVMRGDNNLTVPVLSLRVSSRPELHIYRIADLYGGVDCAREIAISMINDDLAGFFESAETVLYEPIGMRVSFVEAALQRCQNLLTDERQSRLCLSLRRNTAGELAKLVEGKESSSIKVDGIELPLGVIPYLVRMLEIAQEDCLDYLIPEPDNICEGQRRIWQIYTDDCFERWCGVVLPELEKSYRQFVRIFLKELADYLPTYAEGPFALRIEIAPADISEPRSDRHLYIARYPVESEEDIAAEFVNDGYLRDGPDVDGFPQRAQAYIRFARLLGRPGECYQEQEMPGSVLLTGKAYVHQEVRKRVQGELGALFRLH